MKLALVFAVTLAFEIAASGHPMPDDLLKNLYTFSSNDNSANHDDERSSTSWRDFYGSE